jgi:hypothetical protein
MRLKWDLKKFSKAAHLGSGLTDRLTNSTEQRPSSVANA